jgi:hypothetical protein
VSFHENVGRESPKRFAVLLIHCRKTSVGLAIENQASRSCQNPRPCLGTRTPGLRNLPNNLPRVKIERTQKTLSLLIGIATVVVTDTLFECQEIVKACFR